MVRYFMRKLIYFGEVKINESEISSNITMKSVISGLFNPRYLHCCSLY